jgi:hypothetical protein
MTPDERELLLAVAQAAAGDKPWDRNRVLALIRSIARTQPAR